MRHTPTISPDRGVQLLTVASISPTREDRPKRSCLLTLIADGLQHEPNVYSIMDVAGMFGAGCAFRGGVASECLGPETQAPVLKDTESVLAYRPLVAVENAPGAENIFGSRFAEGSCQGLLVGNEVRGIGAQLLSQSDRKIHIPMVSRTIRTLNVAAAAAVAMYGVANGGFRSAETRSDPERRRPELLIVGGSDAFDVGSAIRSAAAFGWSRVHLHDREEVWFGVQRPQKVAARAAARRSRNFIRVIPLPVNARASFKRVLLVTDGVGSVPLRRAKLAGSSGTLLVVSGESDIDQLANGWDALGQDVQVVGLEIPRPLETPRLRLTASIALAEAVRQIGFPPVKTDRFARRVPTGYDSVFKLGDLSAGEDVTLEELLQY